MKTEVFVYLYVKLGTKEPEFKTKVFTNRELGEATFFEGMIKFYVGSVPLEIKFNPGTVSGAETFTPRNYNIRAYEEMMSDSSRN